MILTRILFHMVVIALTLNLVDRALEGQYVPLLRGLLDWLRPGSFIVFSATVAFLANRRPVLLAAVLAVALIASWQFVREDLVGYATPVLLGALAARMVQGLAAEGRIEEEP